MAELCELCTVHLDDDNIFAVCGQCGNIVHQSCANHSEQVNCFGMATYRCRSCRETKQGEGSRLERGVYLKGSASSARKRFSLELFLENVKQITARCVAEDLFAEIEQTDILEAVRGVSAHSQKINQIIYMGWAQEPLEVVRSRESTVEKILADTGTGLCHVSIRCQKY
jgi:hypothetical protein